VSLAILADEAVERVVVTALRSNGYDVAVADERHGEGTIDKDLLRDAAERGEVVLTHDRDFAALAGLHDHTGILILTSQSPDLGAIVQAILIQRENPVVHGGRESRALRRIYTVFAVLHANRGGTTAIGQSRDSNPTLARYPLREW